MAKLVGPDHPWYHPDHPVEHTSYGQYGDSVTIHGSLTSVDEWAGPRIYLKHDNDFGAKQFRVDYSSGGDLQGIDKIEMYNKAHQHAMKIAKDMATHTVARAAVRSEKTPKDIVASLTGHPDHMVSRVAKHRMALYGHEGFSGGQGKL